METSERLSGIKFIGFTILGLAAFFAPVTVNGDRSVPIDLIAVWVSSNFEFLASVFALAIVLVGSVKPFISKTWNSDVFETIFSVLKPLGFIAGLVIFLDMGPKWLMTPDIGQFIFYDLIVYLAFLIPLGGIFLTFVTKYGFLEFFGTLFEKIMRPLWKVPGRSSVNALASRVASPVVIYLLTDEEYRDQKYTGREAAIIATGFVTVEAPFIIVVARTAGIMDHFYLFFFVSMLVTFAVTLITARIWPINRITNEYYNAHRSTSASHESEAELARDVNGSLLGRSWRSAVNTASYSASLPSNLWRQFKSAMAMTFDVLPLVLSIGLIGLIVAEYTAIFDYLGYALYPVTFILGIPEALLAAKASMLGIAEIILPSVVIAESTVVTKFIVASVSITTVLFCSTTIPAILSTRIPLSIFEMVVIWFERLVLSLIIVTPIAYLLL